LPVVLKPYFFYSFTTDYDACYWMTWTRICIVLWWIYTLVIICRHCALSCYIKLDLEIDHFLHLTTKILYD
jgi:hypothetical protein